MKDARKGKAIFHAKRDCLKNPELTALAAHALHAPGTKSDFHQEKNAPATNSAVSPQIRRSVLHC